MRSYPSRSRLSRLIAGIAVTLSLHGPVSAWTPTHRVETPRGYVLLRVMDATSILFAFHPGTAPPAEVGDSPMWSPETIVGHRGGGQVETLKLGSTLDSGNGLSTISVYLDPVTRAPALEVKYTGREAGPHSSYRLDFEEKNGRAGSFRLRAPYVDHLFGLGEQLPPELLGQSDADLLGQVRYPGTNLESESKDPKGVYGNAMVPLAGGSVSNAMFPVLHMIDDSGPDAMLFLDNIGSSRWDFRTSPWMVEIRQGGISGALAWGQESGGLRQKWMSWTGHAPVPPRKAFGMWVSEYGYEHWSEVEEKAQGLAEAGFPVDGFVLDLQWFGGIRESSKDSRMGSLTFDTDAFPKPAEKISELAERGLGIVLIEEPYIAENLPEYQDLAERGFLVRSQSDSQSPLSIDESPWWGLGSMIDFTNPEAADYWHRTKREPLRKLGVVGHWTDLGEPEMFRHLASETTKGKKSYETPLYHGGLGQMEANNLFALRWAESIFRGYGHDSHQSGQRPMILGRTGTAGIQRFGVALWSGDIGANWESLRSHYRAQSHLSMSGIDYFGSDVGGFYRSAYQTSPGGYDELYTRWFGAACLTDIPLRPHAKNLGNTYQTAPNLVGDPASNLQDLRRRYRLIPYLYASSHRAWREGTPMISPPIAHQQGQEALDLSGTHKWIGPDLFARLVLEPGLQTVAVTLPQGRWYDFDTGEKVTDEGGLTLKVPAKIGGLFRTPLYARGGALVPVGSAQSSRMDASGLEVLVFPGELPGQTEVVEDDGTSQEYRGGKVAITELRQSAWRGRFGQVVVGARAGPLASRWDGSRELVIRIASAQRALRAVVDEQEYELSLEGGYQVLRLPDRPSDQKTVIHFR